MAIRLVHQPIGILGLSAYAAARGRRKYPAVAPRGGAGRAGALPQGRWVNPLAALAAPDPLALKAGEAPAAGATALRGGLAPSDDPRAAIPSPPIVPDETTAERAERIARARNPLLGAVEDPRRARVSPPEPTSDAQEAIARRAAMAAGRPVGPRPTGALGNAEVDAEAEQRRALITQQAQYQAAARAGRMGRKYQGNLLPYFVPQEVIDRRQELTDEQRKRDLALADEERQRGLDLEDEKRKRQYTLEDDKAEAQRARDTEIENDLQSGKLVLSPGAQQTIKNIQEGLEKELPGLDEAQRAEAIDKANQRIREAKRYGSRAPEKDERPLAERFAAETYQADDGTLYERTSSGWQVLREPPKDLAAEQAAEWQKNYNDTRQKVKLGLHGKKNDQTGVPYTETEANAYTDDYMKWWTSENPRPQSPAAPRTAPPVQPDAANPYAFDENMQPVAVPTGKPQVATQPAAAAVSAATSRIPADLAAPPPASQQAPPPVSPAGLSERLAAIPPTPQVALGEAMAYAGTDALRHPSPFAPLAQPQSVAESLLAPPTPTTQAAPQQAAATPRPANANPKEMTAKEWNDRAQAIKGIALLEKQIRDLMAKYKSYDEMSVDDRHYLRLAKDARDSLKQQYAP